MRRSNIFIMNDAVRSFLPSVTGDSWERLQQRFPSSIGPFLNKNYILIFNPYIFAHNLRHIFVEKPTRHRWLRDTIILVVFNLLICLIGLERIKL